MGVSPTTATIGQQVVFTMTVTNSGTAAVNGIVPTLTLSGATGALDGPIPASIASLVTTAPGNTGTFTWTFIPATSGPVTATASATGTDALSLAPVTASTVAADILQVRATLGGTITGLTGTGLQLATAGEPNLVVAPGETTFTFVAPLESGTAYDVTVAVQPTGPSQTCTVTSGGTGTIGTANVSDVVVTCVTNSYTVGGTVTGLAAGSSVVLQNNGADDLTVSADGTFTFVTPVASGGTYLVTVLTQPASPPQTCAVSAGTGQVTDTNVASVVVTCGYTIGGTLTGLANAGGVVLQNNGGDNLAVPLDGAFTFATPVPSGGTYLVTVLRQPTAPAQICTVTGEAGLVTSANVDSVLVTCIR